MAKAKSKTKIKVKARSKVMASERARAKVNIMAQIKLKIMKIRAVGLLSVLLNQKHLSSWLDETTKIVGTGRISSQISSHGRDIPDGYLNVEITTIASKVKPHIASPFDEDFVCVGQFTLWPQKQLQAGIRSPINTRSK